MLCQASCGLPQPGCTVYNLPTTIDVHILGLERYRERHPIPNNIVLSQCQYPIPIPIPVRDETLN